MPGIDRGLTPESERAALLGRRRADVRNGDDLVTIAPNHALASVLRAAADALEQPSPMAALDELRPVVKFAKEWDLEAKALVRAAKRAGLAVRLGRELVARRSDLLALVDLLRAEQSAKAQTSTAISNQGAYTNLVARAKTSRRAA